MVSNELLANCITITFFIPFYDQECTKQFELKLHQIHAENFDAWMIFRYFLFPILDHESIKKKEGLDRQSQTFSKRLVFGCVSFVKIFFKTI